MAVPLSVKEPRPPSKQEAMCSKSKYYRVQAGERTLEWNIQLMRVVKKAWEQFYFFYFFGQNLPMADFAVPIFIFSAFYRFRAKKKLVSVLSWIVFLAERTGRCKNSNYETRKLITKTKNYSSNDDDEHIHVYLFGIWLKQSH